MLTDFVNYLSANELRYAEYVNTDVCEEIEYSIRNKVLELHKLYHKPNVDSAVLHDDFKLVKYMINQYEVSTVASINAIINGNLDMFEYLVILNKLNKSASLYTVIHNRYNIFKYMISNKLYIHMSTLRHAVELGNYKLVKFLCKNKHIYKHINYISCKNVIACIRNNHVKTLKYLISIGELEGYGIDDARDIIHTAIESCNIEIIKLIIPGFDKRYIDTNYIIDVVKKNNVEVIKTLYELGVLFDNQIINVAAKLGHMNMVEYLKSLGFKISGHIFTTLLISGNNAIDNFIGDDDMIILPDTLDVAARVGHLQMLKWLCEKGYKFTEKTLDLAIQHQQLEVVKFLIENKCNHSMFAADHAYNVGNISIVNYLHSVGIEPYMSV